MNIKERSKQRDPEVGDTVYELDNNSNIIAEYVVNENYDEKDYPELITVRTVRHLKGWFERDEDTIKCKEQLMILRP